MIRQDSYGRSIVFLDEILFYGKRKIKWNDVEDYLKQYVGDSYEIVETNDVIHISKDFPDEFSHSNDTARLNGTLAKAKANAALCIPQLIENATNKRFKENLGTKHSEDAKMGWYRYTARFALPVSEEGKILVRYNVFRIEILVRRKEDMELFLYDLVNIKKEASIPLEP